jgi:hypothetical protein
MTNAFFVHSDDCFNKILHKNEIYQSYLSKLFLFSNKILSLVLDGFFIVFYNIFIYMALIY